MNKYTAIEISVDLIFTLILALIVWYIYRDHVSSHDSKYSTFWPRFWAPTIDELVLWPFLTLLPVVIISMIHLDEVSSYIMLMSLPPMYYLYSIYFHSKYGATIGKMKTKVRVVDAGTEREITFKQALFRDIVPLALVFILFVFSFGVNSIESPNDLEHLSYIPAAMGIWFLAEILTMLTNNKRRALHDFIAGTVVVRADINDMERVQQDDGINSVTSLRDSTS